MKDSCFDSCCYWLFCAGYDLCSLDGNEEVLTPPNQNQGKQCSVSSPVTTSRPVNTPPHRAQKLLLVERQHLWGGALHRKITAPKDFSLIGILDKRRTLRKQRNRSLAMLSSKQTAVHYCLGNVSVFNRIMAVWFDVFLSDTKESRVFFGAFFCF